MFGKKKKAASYIEYDREKQKPVIKCSICTGEQVAGFKDLLTGKFTEVMLIRNAEDLDSFKRLYNLDTLTKEY